MVYFRKILNSIFLMCIYNFHFDTSNAKTFEIVVKGIDKSYKSEYVDFTGIKMRKLGRGKHVVNGTYKVLKDVDGELLRTNVITAKRFGSAYLVQPYASWMNINNCKQYDDDKLFVPYFYQHTNTPRGCPSPKGQWEVWNLTADPNSIPSVLPYGDYKITVQALLNGTEVWKGVLDFVIQPSLN
ncbi:uncharacterized protein LOC123290663 [Chrysoperla carnea]|uniref:uncharacterized protein LOC123290663 n=1 Tax=Chrysoperla carnea TaxID=189513 RepID=UPI001D070086|nr:uncharacterized protein LOC123290663 [Chrysoperla carnea]